MKTNKKIEEANDRKESEQSGSSAEFSNPDRAGDVSGLPTVSEKVGADAATPAPPPAMLEEVYGRTIVLQLAGTLPANRRDAASLPDALDDAVALYKGMDPVDPLDSALCRFIVALTNAGMDRLEGAAASAGLSQTQEKDLKLGMKAAVTTADLIKVLDSRRVSGRQRVNVGQVNIQSGGQAIIGNVSNTKRAQAPSAPAGGGGDDDDAH